MWSRRLFSLFVAVLSLGFMCYMGTRDEPAATYPDDRQVDFSIQAWWGDSTRYFDDQQNGRVLFYNTAEDTAGNGTEMTFVSADTFFTASDIGWGVYEFWYYNDTRSVLLLDNVFVGAAEIPDSALGLKSVNPLAIDTDSLFNFLSVKLTDSLHVGDDARVVDTLIVEGDVIFEGGVYVGSTPTQWDDGSEKIDGEIIADDTIDDDSIDWTDVDLDDVPDGSSYERVPACTGVGHFLYGNGISIWTAGSPGTSITIDGATGKIECADNSLDAEKLYSAANPADGDLVGVTTSDALTFLTPIERHLIHSTGIDTIYMGETTFPGGTTTSWTEWKSGAEVGDQCFSIMAIGSPPTFSNLGQKGPYALACSCATTGQLTFFREPDYAKAAGEDAMLYMIIRWERQ